MGTNINKQFLSQFRIVLLYIYIGWKLKKIGEAKEQSPAKGFNAYGANVVPGLGTSGR